MADELILVYLKTLKCKTGKDGWAAWLEKHDEAAIPVQKMYLHDNTELTVGQNVFDVGHQSFDDRFKVVYVYVLEV